MPLRKSKHSRKYQQKLVQNLNLTFTGSCQRDIDSFSVFSRFHGIKKGSLFMTDKSLKKDITSKAFKTLFRILKRLKRVEFQQVSISDQQNSKTFKPFTLLTSLEFLNLPRFTYSRDPKNLQPLMHSLKLASKRRSWPRLRSLNLGPLYPQGLTIIRGTCPPPLESLKNVVEFMQGLDSCENIRKCFNIQLMLPFFPSAFDEEKGMLLLSELSHLMSFSLASLDISELRNCSKILEIFQHSTNLKKITIGITEEFQEKVDLDILNRMPSFQELQIWVRNDKSIDLLSHSDILPQVKTMSNLTTLSFDIGGKQRAIEESNLNLSGVISGLTNLKSLRLNFGRYSKEPGDDKDAKPLNGAWFDDVFKAIGRRTTLKKLDLSMTHLIFENKRRLFGGLCESLKNLEQLADLTLEFYDRTATIEETDMVEFCQCFSNLKNLQGLYLTLACSNFQSEALNELLCRLVTSFPILSRIMMRLEGVKVNSQAYECLERIVKDHRCLNVMSLALIGQIEEGLDPDFFQNEMRKRFPGNIYFVSK